MQKIFCDDGSTFVKLAYADEQKKLVTKITETSFLAGNWNFAFGQNIYNYEIEGKRYSFNDGITNASETTTVNYQYSDENLLSVHHALLNTDLTPCEIELYVTLPLCEFFNEQRQKNTKNIERKKANLLREIKYHDGEGYKDTFKIKKVHVSPESLTALHERFKHDDVNDYESSLIVDLGGTTLDCGVVLGKFRQLTHVIAEPSLGVSSVIKRIQKIVKSETNIGLSYASANNLMLDIFYKKYEFLSSLVNRDQQKLDRIKSETEDAINNLSVLVSGKLKTFNEFQRIYLIGGGSSLIKDKIVKDFEHLKNKIYQVPDSQFALVKSIANMILGDD